MITWAQLAATIKNTNSLESVSTEDLKAFHNDLVRIIKKREIQESISLGYLQEAVSIAHSYSGLIPNEWQEPDGIEMTLEYVREQTLQRIEKAHKLDQALKKLKKEAGLSE